MIILITGDAGFIGAKTAELLLLEKHTIIGIDNLNDYYDVRIKEHRFSFLKKDKNFQFLNKDIESHNSIEKIFLKNKIDLQRKTRIWYSNWTLDEKCMEKAI